MAVYNMILLLLPQVLLSVLLMLLLLVLLLLPSSLTASTKQLAKFSSALMFCFVVSAMRRSYYGGGDDKCSKTSISKMKSFINTYMTIACWLWQKLRSCVCLWREWLPWPQSYYIFLKLIWRGVDYYKCELLIYKSATTYYMVILFNWLYNFPNFKNHLKYTIG